MVCTKCGAEYDNTFDKCPYCGEVFKIPDGENKKKKKVYGKNVRKLARTLKIQEESAEKILKTIPYILGVIAILVCIFAAYKYFSGVGSKAHKTMVKNVNQLDGLVKDESFEKVYSKVKSIKNPLKYDEYVCYYAVSEIYGGGKEFVEKSKEAAEVFETGNHDIIDENAKAALRSLAEMHFIYEAVVAKYGAYEHTTEYAESILNWFVKLATEKYKLSESEVYEVMREGYSDVTVIDSYTDVVFRRVRATGDAYITDDFEAEEEF